MSVYRQYNPNDKTSAFQPSEAGFAVSRSQNARNSDLNQGHPEELLPHNGLDRDGLFRAPIGFREPGSNASGYGSRVQGQARFNGQATGSDRRGSDWKAGRVSSATEEVIAAINEEKRRQSAVLEPIPNSENTPHFSAMQIFEIALMCEVCLVIGFYIGWAVGR